MAGPAANISGSLRNNDTANYPATFTVRGNLKTHTSGGVTTTYNHDITGTIISTNAAGTIAAVETSSATNYTAPDKITPNSTPDLASQFSYTSFLGLSTGTGPNAATVTYSYNAEGRPTQTKSPHGALTTYAYDDANRRTTARTYQSSTATGSYVYVRTTTDALGRPIRVENGPGSSSSGDGAAVSEVLTEYAPCACTPVGKVKRTSRPFSPGGAVKWTETVYDGVGRTLQVIQPDGSGTSTYVYQGNTVTVTDPAAKWKKYETDALGHLVKVTEPRPGGGTYDTTYAYNLLGQLTTVTMPRDGVTQTRTFTYDIAGNTGRLLSHTFPESGTTTYTYNTNGTLQKKTDAKNQREEYVYDALKRVTSIRRYRTNGTEDLCAKVTFYHDANSAGSSDGNRWGRLAEVRSGATSCASGVEIRYQYRYTAAGLVTEKRMSIETGMSLTATWSYNARGQVTSVQYPDTRDVAGGGTIIPGITFNYTFDSMGRPNKMTESGGPDWVKDVFYNAAAQMTQMHAVGHTNPMTMTYNTLGQLTRMTQPGRMDMEYRFPSTQNDGRITQSKDWISGEEVTYQYDELNRLVSAVTTGPA